MRLFTCWAVSLSLLLPACAMPRHEAGLSPQSVSELEEACRDLRQVDMARLSRGKAEWSRFDDLHDEARRNIAPPEADGGGIALRLAIPGGSPQAPYGLSVWATRQRDGTWRVSHVRHLQLRPPPQPPGTQPLPEPPATIAVSGRWKPQAARLVEAALASECLDREPFLSPVTLPMKDGTERPCPPDGGGANALEILESGAARRYLRECGRTWASGIIIITLENRDNLIVD
jgi:hypothetical protein